MAKIIDKLRKFWYFRIANPVIAKGAAGGFKWTFRKYFMVVETLSGNWKMRITAGEYPYGYLLTGVVQKHDENNIQGFCQTLYAQAMMLTRDQKLVNDVQKALWLSDKRLVDAVKGEEREDEAALESVRQEQEYKELPKKEQRKVDREINGRFKKTVKKAEK